ncbi:ABC transporter ATP-binding protein [Solwaraspora sp. WMMA2080]|uniref:ABC transporter ATP-binding protein n=1 Tax=unclassified Solwaraspora TaxID=2627926 RepID=UPI00248BF7DD|nr:MULTISPECIES: ABC transporter ATP-binding protein [unclassified Solwaraspora]WBB95774.1 ABC transporter ATP-binding protein [Solwaraspora sp. WMMA2059]WBC20322.1 ABC transporter ATP-binding protein [Solwaraspora sp. WMMA2080]
MSVIEIEHLHKRYGDLVAVDDVSFTVDEGEIFGILGRNGAGKTTTVECALGLRRPDRGTVRVLGLDPQRDGARLRQRLGAQLQESQLPERIKVWEALELYSSFYRQPADWRELLDLLGLSARHDARFGQLSGGQKQRLSVALALVGDPKVAFLDELTTGLDPAARRDTWGLVESVRNRGVTLVLVTHLMEEAERLCDRVAVIDAGRVVALDTPAGLAASVDSGQRIRFVPDRPLDLALLAELPQVTAVTIEGREVVVDGGAELFLAVAAALSRHGVTPRELRLQQATLDDAFLALTGGDR